MKNINYIFETLKKEGVTTINGYDANFLKKELEENINESWEYVRDIAILHKMEIELYNLCFGNSSIKIHFPIMHEQFIKNTSIVRLLNFSDYDLEVSIKRCEKWIKIFNIFLNE